jgi:hypothetical protein
MRRHGHEVALIAHINSAGIGMDNGQAGIVASQTPSQVLPLLAD